VNYERGTASWGAHRRKSALLIAVAAIALSCVDPVHDDEVAALGPDVGPKGPEHRPGQPCLVCHGGSGPASAHFSVAGTIYQVKGQSAPLVNAFVRIIDANQLHVDATTNAAGNFYIRVEDWTPPSPLYTAIATDKASLTPCDGSDPKCVPMFTRIGREGSCAACHTDPPSSSSTGRVYFYADPSDVPGGQP
jgi:hypothetical protein